MIRCDFCGKFISYEDLERGEAYRVLLTPSSEYSEEEFETCCKSCNKDK